MPTLWIDDLMSLSVAAGSQSSQTLGPASLTDIEDRLLRLTLLRTIVRIDVAPTVPDSGEGDQVIDMGIAVVSMEAQAASAFPDPVVESDFPTRPWLYRARYRVYAVAAGDQNREIVRIDKDLRGKRKLENGKLMFIVDNSDNQGVSSPCQITGIIRQLYLIG